MNKSSIEAVLPKELLFEIQKYIQGKSVYIPKPKDGHKKWGDITQSKAVTAERNNEIRSAFRNGLTIDELSERYLLSQASIKKVVYDKT